MSRGRGPPRGERSYFTDEEDPVVVKFDRLKVMAEKVGAFCAQNPRMSLMNAAESVMVK